MDVVLRASGLGAFPRGSAEEGEGTHGHVSRVILSTFGLFAYL